MANGFDMFDKINSIIKQEQSEKQDDIKQQTISLTNVQPVVVEHKTYPTKPLVKTVEEKGKKPYPFANGREPKKVSFFIYAPEEARRRGLELGFSSGALSHYVNYLIDKDLGLIK